MFTTGLYGVYATLDKFARTIGNSGDPGSLGGSITRYTKAQGEIAQKLTAIAGKQEALRAQLARNFTWADRDISASQSTLSFLQGQIDAWNARD
jgi:flagellar hook-associated protein 2